MGSPKSRSWDKDVSARGLFGGDSRSRRTGKIKKKDRERKAVNTGQERD